MLTREDLIGMKFTLRKETYQVEWAGESHDVTEYHLADPAFEAQIKALYSNVRIVPPGTVYTLEYRPGRFNVHLNEHGTITRITEG